MSHRHEFGGGLLDVKGQNFHDKLDAFMIEFVERYIFQLPGFIVQKFGRRRYWLSLKFFKALIYASNYWAIFPGNKVVAYNFSV
ncbi:hypothetical+protein [Methylocapsa aurea]